MAVNILVFFVLLLNRVAPECSAEGTAGLGEDGEPRRMSTSSNMLSTDSAFCGPIAIYSIQNGEMFPAGKDGFLKTTLQRNITDDSELPMRNEGRTPRCLTVGTARLLAIEKSRILGVSYQT